LTRAFGGDAHLAALAAVRHRVVDQVAQGGKERIAVAGCNDVDLCASHTMILHYSYFPFNAST